MMPLDLGFAEAQPALPEFHQPFLPMELPMVAGAFRFEVGDLVTHTLTGIGGRVVDRYRDTAGNDRYEVKVRTSRSSHSEWVEEALLNAA